MSGIRSLSGPSAVQASRSASPPPTHSNRSSTLSSSAASFQTAAGYNTESRAGSARESPNTTPNPDTADVNPLHTMAQQQQQVHILKVKGDVVQLGTSPPDSLLQSVGDRLRLKPRSETPPPAAEKTPLTEKVSRIASATTKPMLDKSFSRKPEPAHDSSDAVIYDEPTSMDSDGHRRSTSASSAATFKPTPAPVALQRSSTTADPRPSPSIRPHSVQETASQSTSAIPARAKPAPPSSLLAPPTAHSRRPTRRNTTGSAQRPRFPVPAPHSQITADTDLADDIQLHAEQIRRERMNKRAKQAPQPEDKFLLKERDFSIPLAKGKEKEKDPREGEGPLVGNLIGEDHVNYVLMYNMLTGIRIGVSRCQAKMKRALTDEDFTAQHKYSFDIVGNELTPSVHYDFKFKDYAPWVFRELREDHFHLDPADYLLSLTAKYILSELGSPGKSGSFFYFSRDYRFIIKTIRHEEHKFLRSVLKDYVNHVRSNPHTLLSRFYGLHRVKMPHGRKIHFVIMNNLFPPHRDIHETYDLKGSTIGRYAQEDPPPQPGEKPKSSKVLKDINWIKKGRRLELGPEKRALLTEQLRRDKEFLKNIHGENGGRHGVMDYSLLVGIHSMERGNRDHVRRKTLKVFEPELRGRRTPATHYKDPAEAHAVRRAMRQSDPKQLEEHELTQGHPTHHRRTSTSSANGPGSPVNQPSQPKSVTVDPPASAPAGRTSTSSTMDGPSLVVPNQQPVPEDASHGALGPADELLEGASLDELFQDRQHFLFYQDEGGLRATDEGNLPMDTIYYLGVIDILTPYGTTKKAEHFWKGLKADRHKISPVPPSDYAERFFSFMKTIMRNGGQPEDFLASKDR